jgi:hypothetical protein
VSNNVPAVIPPQPSPVVSPACGDLLTAPVSPQETSELVNLKWAAPLAPGAAHGAVEALLDHLQNLLAGDPHAPGATGQVVEVACELARDPQLTAEARVAALQVGAEVALADAAARKAAADRQPRWPGRVLQVVGAAAIIAGVAVAVRTPEPRPLRAPSQR